MCCFSATSGADCIISQDVEPDILAQAADMLDERAGSSALLSVKQAAEFMQVSERTMWTWIAKRIVPASTINHRTTRIKRSDLDDLLESTRR